jgi:hypothetical protein
MAIFIHKLRQLSAMRYHTCLRHVVLARKDMNMTICSGDCQDQGCKLIEECDRVYKSSHPPCSDIIESDPSKSTEPKFPKMPPLEEVQNINSECLDPSVTKVKIELSLKGAISRYQKGELVWIVFEEQ